MKRILLTLMLGLLSGVCLIAQNLNLYKTNGSISTMPLSTIDSITFSDGGAGGQGEPCPGSPTVTDFDGNGYNTALIGDQCWMKENLKTTHYSDGTAILYPGANNNAWLNNDVGAYAWYDNSLSWKDKYGALYNWPTVINPSGLCPDGWHVPSLTEWNTLIAYIGGSIAPGGNIIKSCRQIDSPLGGDCSTSTHPRWRDHHTHYGTDDYGFSGFPGGSRSGGTALFYNLGETGYLWSSTEYSSYSAVFVELGYNRGNSSVDYFQKKAGFSVRCIKD